MKTNTYYNKSMKKSISHLPKQKQDEIKKIVKIILKHATVEMVILFGSHARGDSEKGEWVKHKYVKEHVLYEYKSDFDILIVVKKKSMEEDFGVWDLIEAEAYKQGVSTWLGIIVDNIHYVNEQLELGRYFYSDIRKEGVLLYDSENYKLAKARKLSGKEQKELAKKDFKYWFESANNFFDDYEINLEKKRYNNAAFYLHQATERYISAILLVFTGYRPKSHDLKRLFEKTDLVDTNIQKFFNTGINVEKERKLFELLRKAYVDARYEKDYKITKKELELLGNNIVELKKMTKTLCAKKI